MRSGTGIIDLIDLLQKNIEEVLHVAPGALKRL